MIKCYKPWPILMLIYYVIQMCATSVISHNEADKITSLPGQPKASFQQYAGYVTIDEKQKREYFYYFVEAAAANDSSSKPLVLWLNGGPGCSSIGAGAFGEHGPFQPSGNVLVANQHSWNKEANMLYLESPAGVGFSYSANKSFYDFVTDEMTAKDNLIFLKKWLDNFPEYKNNDFYILGESYGGHYVPQLANLIMQSKAKINLKGIAIGNPLLEFNTDFNSRAEYLWSHGLISDATYSDFTHVCNYSTVRRQAETGSLSPVCVHVVTQVQSEISRSVDPYDVTIDVCLSSVLMQSEILSEMRDKSGIDVCVGDETDVYLNREDVKKALHARLVGVNRWGVCSNVLHYDMQNLEIPTIGVLGTLIKTGIRVLVYSGDQDSVLPFTATRTLVDGLAKDLGLNTTVPYSAWFEEKQVGGWTQVYGDLLSFATIRGASHEAPFSQPERSLLLFSSFLGGKPLPRTISKTKGTNSLIRLI